MSPDNGIRPRNPENTELPIFIESTSSNHLSARCVDGRKDPNSKLGPQMLGGSSHPLFLSAIYSGQKFDRDFVIPALAVLKENKFGIGAHRGSHKTGENSDCGADDRIQDIFLTSLKDEEIIRDRLMTIYQANVSHFQFDESFETMLDTVYQRFKQYSIQSFELTGEELVKTIEKEGGVVENVQGDHAEGVAFVNIKNDTTLDTKTLNDQNRQAFNLDIWAAIKQAKALGVDTNFAVAASLILYAATEIVLVEQKRKPALEVVIHG